MNSESKGTEIPKRALSLDALRGLAILMMILSSTIPFGVLPSWMYHAQEPPPFHLECPNLPGITWVDLVFPFFLFSMGAALPIALSRKLERGARLIEMVKSIGNRGVLLVCFAIYICHVNPRTYSVHPDWRNWVFALLGFTFIFPVLARIPQSVSRSTKYIIRAIGWVGALAMLAVVRFPDGSAFSLVRSDIIILVLANAAVFGSIIWLLSPGNWMLRLGVLGLLLGIRVSAASPGWTQYVWANSPLPWLFEFRFLSYLFIVIPGSIIGDMILAWMKSEPNNPEDGGRWSIAHYSTVIALSIFIIFEVVTGLKIRQVFPSLVLSMLLGIVILLMTGKPHGAAEKFITSISRWGLFWLVLGFCFEPFEGGIKKDPSTLSYYFITAGLAIFALVIFTITIDILGKKKIFSLLIHSGQNPMVAYAGLNNLVVPILALTKLDAVLAMVTPTPWLGVLGGMFITSLVALAAALFSKYKIFLRT